MIRFLIALMLLCSTAYAAPPRVVARGNAVVNINSNNNGGAVGAARVQSFNSGGFHSQGVRVQNFNSFPVHSFQTFAVPVYQQSFQTFAVPSCGGGAVVTSFGY